MEKPIEVIARMAVTENGLYITGTRVYGWALTNAIQNQISIPLINTKDLLFGKYPSFYNNGTLGIHLYMKPDTNTDLIGTDFTISAWIKTDDECLAMSKYLDQTTTWINLVGADSIWRTSNELTFLLGGGYNKAYQTNNFINDSKSHDYYNCHKNINNILNLIYKEPYLVTPIVQLKYGSDSDSYTVLFSDRLDPFTIDFHNHMTKYHHIAFTRKDESVYLFVDGKLQCTSTSSQNHISQVIFSSSDLNFMQSYFSGNEIAVALRCSYNDICIVKGKALWTEEFTPPTDFILQDYLTVEGTNKTIWGFSQISPQMPTTDKGKINLYKSTKLFTEPSLQDYKKINDTFKIHKYKGGID